MQSGGGGGGEQLQRDAVTEFHTHVTRDGRPLTNGRRPRFELIPRCVLKNGPQGGKTSNTNCGHWTQIFCIC
jgi:hypothetical protein